MEDESERKNLGLEGSAMVSTVQSTQDSLGIRVLDVE